MWEPLIALAITSPAFSNSGLIDARHTCEGTDISPELQGTGESPETKSFALIVDDPDAPDPKAPKMTWVHWVIYNIPATVHALPDNPGKQGLPMGAKAVGLARRSEPIAIFSSFTRSTRCCPTWVVRPRRNCWMR